MNAFNEWWQKEEDLMRKQGADDEIILGAMRNIAEMAWNTAQHQWQPIETAPESGPFLVHGGMFRSELYADSKTREPVKVSGRAPHIMFHNKGDILFYVADANYHEVWVVNPTHWMPLPEAPEEERNEC